MKILITTFKYGDLRTRLLLGAVLFLMFSGLALGVTGLLGGSIISALIGAGMLILGAVIFVMGHFSRTQYDDMDDRKPKPNHSLESGDNESNGRKKPDISGDEHSSNVNADSDGSDNSIRDRLGTAGIATKGKDWPKKYTNDSVKVLLKRYKVKRKFIPIVIDECRSKVVSRTPAYLWLKKDTVNLLLLEPEERVVSMSLRELSDVGYERGVQEKKPEEYEMIKDRLGVYSQFKDVMPTFNGSVGLPGQYLTKNLYVLGKDLKLPPRSFKALKNAGFVFDIHLADSLGMKADYSRYFRRAYDIRLMWSDTVISQNDYQSGIKAILEDMLNDPRLDKYDFMDELDRMEKHRLITDEFAQYYADKRRALAQNKKK